MKNEKCKIKNGKKEEVMMGAGLEARGAGAEKQKEEGRMQKRERPAAGLMKKVRSNAAWNGLSREKRATLEHWLFEEGLSYNAALERARSEVGFTGSKTSLRRFYERARSERLLSGLTDTGNLARTVEESDVSVERLRSAGLKLAAEMFVRTVASAPEKTQEWAPLAKLLLQAEKNEAWREVKEQENAIRERALDFARLKYQYDTMANALRLLPKLKEIEEANKDPEVLEFEDNKRINDLRRGLFGENIPGVLPETPEERDNPEILRAREKEAYARQMEKFARAREEREREWAAMRAKTKVTEGAVSVVAAVTNEEKILVQNEGEAAEKTGTEDENEDENEDEAEDGDESEGTYYPGGGK